jgi:hypothetical protein
MTATRLKPSGGGCVIGEFEPQGPALDTIGRRQIPAAEKIAWTGRARLGAPHRKNDPECDSWSDEGETSFHEKLLVMVPDPL